MMKSKSWINYGLFLICILFFGCKSNEEEVSYLKEPQDIEILSAERIKALHGISTSSIGLVDTTLMVINNSSYPQLSFYNLTDFKLIARYGNKGQSPNQLINAKYNGQYYISNNQIFFWLGDTKKNQLMLYSLAKVLKDSSTVPEKKIILPPEIASVYVSIFSTADGSLIGNQFGMAPNTGRFFIYDPKTERTTWSPFFPSVNEKIDPDNLSDYYYSQCAFNPDSNLLISAMYYFKRLDLVNPKSLNYKTKVYDLTKDYIPPYIDKITFKAQPPKRFFSFVYSGKHYFYALCINDLYKNYLEDRGNMELHVFNWSGDLVKVLKLDRLHIGRFVVDEKNKALYAINYGEDRDTTPILKYNLNSLSI